MGVMTSEDMKIFKTKFGAVCEKTSDGRSVEFKNTAGEVIAYQYGVKDQTILNINTQKPVTFTNAEGEDKTLETFIELMENGASMQGEEVNHFTEIRGQNDTLITLFTEAHKVCIARQKIKHMPHNT